jgi:hypothetical protein
VALLYDAHGREIYPDGVTHDDVRDAIQAASRADDWKLAYEIACRYGWKVCVYCAEKSPTETFNSYRGQLGGWPVCKPCKDVLDPVPDFADVKLYTHGLIKRNVV